MFGGKDDFLGFDPVKFEVCVSLPSSRVRAAINYRSVRFRRGVRAVGKNLGSCQIIQGTHLFIKLLSWEISNM